MLQILKNKIDFNSYNFWETNIVFFPGIKDVRIILFKVKSETSQNNIWNIFKLKSGKNLLKVYSWNIATLFYRKALTKNK